MAAGDGRGCAPAAAPLDAVRCADPSICLAVGSIPVNSAHWPVDGPAPSVTTVLRSTDGGARWTAVLAPGGPIAVSAVSCDPTLTCRAGGTRFVRGAIGGVGMELASADGGATWALGPVTTAVGLQGGAQPLYPQVIDGYGQRRCVTGAGYDDASGDGALEITNNAGTTWQLASGWEEPYPDAPLSFSCTAAGVCLAVRDGTAQSGAVDVTVGTDGGATWSPTAS